MDEIQLTFITIPGNRQQVENDWVVKNVDPAGAETWKIDIETDTCSIALQDDGSDYFKKMVARYNKPTVPGEVFEDRQDYLENLNT